MESSDMKELIERLQDIKMRGWIENGRHGNCGGVGNTLEDLLGVQENNLQLPDFGDWEIKSQRLETSSLTTLFHIEPLPRAAGVVPKLLLPQYGWLHEEAGTKYPVTERSFRQTINCNTRSDRGFMVQVERDAERLSVSFDAKKVSEKHKNWLKSVEERVGLAELNPKPYWEFSTLYSRIQNKLQNCFYVQAETKLENGKEYYRYVRFTILLTVTIENFIKGLEQGAIYVDFDARTGHNHGTKFRIKQNAKALLFNEIITIE